MTGDSRADQDEIFAKIGRLVGELTRLRQQDEDPIIVGWALAYEYTSVDIEQADRFGIGTAAPREQSGALSRGLFDLGAESWSHSSGGDDD